MPHASGALFAPESETLLIADLHLEQGASLARRGVHVPPYDTASTLTQLAGVLAETAPKRLVLLGDSFHDDHGLSHLPVADRRQLEALVKRQETIWISGNHDSATGEERGQLGEIALCHIPELHLRGYEIAGHLHPGCTVFQRGVRLRGKCFVSDARRIILPAFGAYTGALDVSNVAFSGLLEMKTARAHMIGAQAIHEFPLSRLL